MRKPTLLKRTSRGVLYWKPEVSNLNLRNNLRKTEGGKVIIGNLRLYLRKTRRGGRGSGDVSPMGKQKEVEVFPDGPLGTYDTL